MSALFLVAALSIEFIGPCSVKPLLQSNVSGEFPHVGAVTVSTLDRFEVDYAGNEAGLNSVFGTPTGMQAMEVISDTEMRSYGWCFDVDGRLPEEFPDHVSLQGVRHVRWFFGFAHYLNGQWVSQCEPAYKVKPAFLCQ